MSGTQHFEVPGFGWFDIKWDEKGVELLAKDHEPSNDHTGYKGSFDVLEQDQLVGTVQWSWGRGQDAPEVWWVAPQPATT